MTDKLQELTTQIAQEIFTQASKDPEFNEVEVYASSGVNDGEPGHVKMEFFEVSHQRNIKFNDTFRIFELLIEHRDLNKQICNDLWQICIIKVSSEGNFDITLEYQDSIESFMETIPEPEDENGDEEMQYLESLNKRVEQLIEERNPGMKKKIQESYRKTKENAEQSKHNDKNTNEIEGNSILGKLRNIFK